jgi:hypothetical protein
MTPPTQAGAISGLDAGLQWQFVSVVTTTNQVYEGQVIGVYNEAKFMWNPTPYSTLAIFTCSDPTVELGAFGVVAGGDPAIFSLSSVDITSVTVVGQPARLAEYQEYMRLKGHVWSVTPVVGEVRTI